MGDFASAHRVGLGEAYKNLAALAITNFDGRYYNVMSPFAASMGGTNAFARAVLQVHTALMAAAKVDPTLLREPNRSKFIFDFVQNQISAAGLLLAPELGRLLIASLGMHLEPLPSAGPSAAEDRPRQKVKVPHKVRRSGETDPAPAAKDPIVTDDKSVRTNEGEEAVEEGYKSIDWNPEARDRQHLRE